MQAAKHERLIMRAFTEPNGAPKSHRRPRVCKECKDNPKGACLLPFRHLTMVRKWKAFEAKPHLPKHKGTKL